MCTTRLLFLATLAFTVLSNSCITFAQDKPRVTAEQLILPGEVFDVEGKQAFVFLPDQSKRTNPQPWIMYAPTLLPQYPDKHEKWMHEQFLAAGIAVVGVDVGEAYGNPNANDIVDKLYSQMVDKRGFAPKPCLFGRSRGGLWVSSWAIRNPNKVAGIIAIYPVFDLTTYPGIAKAAPAYGLSAEALEAQLAQHNPIQNIGKLVEAKIPVTIIHGAVDEVVPLKQNSAKLEQTYRDAGQQNLVKLIVVDDQGHNFWPGFFNCQELVDFAITKAKDAR